MAKRIFKYEVEGTLDGRCGSYQMIRAKNLTMKDKWYNSLIADHGYKKGDIVELEISESGHELWVKKNGVLIYEYDAAEERKRHDAYMTNLLISKGLKHPVYNP